MAISEIIVVTLCLSVGLSDLYTRHISNALTLGGSMVALSWLFVTDHSMLGASWQSVISGVILSSTLTVPGYLTRQVGAGDVKWILALSLIGGWLIVVIAFVIAAILSAVFYVVQFIPIWLGSDTRKRGRWIPFGTALSIGLLFAMRLPQ